MRKVVIAAVAAIAIVPTLLLAASPAAHACSGSGPAYQLCCVAAQATGVDPCPGYPPISGPTPPQAPRPVQTPQAPPTYAPPSTMPVQTPQVKPPPPPTPTTVPVQTSKINPPGPGAPRNAALVTPPKELDAPAQAVAAAKAAPATRVNPANPPKPPTQVDFNHQVQNVVSNHSGNVDVVKADNQALTRPRHWGYVDYDTYHRPALYNPLSEAMTFRYFYKGAYRDVSVPAGGRVVLDVATVGLFPFTAVSNSYLASGSFFGGGFIPPDGWSGPPPPDYTAPSDPTVYQDVSAYVPADNQTVQVGQVTVVGHDDSQPAGSQDIFMLDDNTLAWGQVNDPSSGAQITVTKTQSVPGVGPTDNGSFLVTLAANQQPAHAWWPWVVGALGGAVAVIAVGLIAWTVTRHNRARI
jgi:hypothetical protein